MKAMQRLWTEEAGANAQATPGSPEGLLSTVGSALEGLIDLGCRRARTAPAQTRLGPVLFSTYLLSCYFVSSEHLLPSGMLGARRHSPVLNIKATCG